MSFYTIQLSSLTSIDFFPSLKNSTLALFFSHNNICDSDVDKYTYTEYESLSFSEYSSKSISKMHMLIIVHWHIGTYITSSPMFIAFFLLQR